MTLTPQQLANGLALEKDLVFPRKPDHPEMRESVSVWLFDDKGEFSFPRGGIEAEAWSWEDRLLQANFAFKDGRVLNGAGRGPAPSPIDAEGKPTIIGAGPLTFRCVEPFRRWTMKYDGTANDGTVFEQYDQTFYTKPAKKTHIRLEVDLTMATPAWIQEVSTATEKMSKRDAENAQAMGLGYRFEHHFRARGVVEIDGKKREFTGTGTRVHRQSIRRLEGFYGHCWLSALFPDGRAFACLVYPPRDGQTEYSYNDAVIYKDGRMIAAQVVQAPMLRRVVKDGDDASVILKSELGTTHIKGVTALSTFRVGSPELKGLSIQQGGALFTWDDQSAYGMVERSDQATLIEIG